MRWSSTAKTPTRSRRASVGWPTSSRANGLRVHVGVGGQAQLLELLGGEQVRLVDQEDDPAPALLLLGGEQALGLGDQVGLVHARGGPSAWTRVMHSPRVPRVGLAT